MSGKEILDQIGEAALLEGAAEECAELAHACLKMARKLRGENPTPVGEAWIAASVRTELADLLTYADVLLCLPWMAPEKVEEIKAEKMSRWGKRIDDQAAGRA